MTLEISEDLVARLTIAADAIWEERKNAGELLESCSESLRLKDLNSKWAIANRRIEAAKLLLSGKAEIMQDIAVA